MRGTAARPTKRGSIESLLRILADRTRLRLLHLMSGQEICVCYLVEVLGTSQPKISRHLALLRKAGIVAVRREGKWMHYRISREGNPAVSRILEQLKPLFAEDAEMRRDTARLSHVCCAPRKFIRLSRAPVPTPIPAKPSRKAPSIAGKARR